MGRNDIIKQNGMINWDKIGEMNEDIKSLGSQMGDFAINIRQFGAHNAEETGYENFNNHDSIISALNYAKLNNISTIQFPSGTINTSPINFKDYSNITLKGNASNYYSDFANQNGTIIKIITTGDVGLQFSDTVSPQTYNSPHSCKVQDIKLDCNNKVRCGINGNFDFELDHVTVVNAIEDGIILEDLSYPVKLTHVFCTYNGRHGFYAKGAMSTVYSLNDCEFSRNGGYGMLIEGGAFCQFDKIILQLNAIGGLKIYKAKNKYNDSHWGGVYYLANLIFNSIYTEANGTLNSGDPMFEGNYAIVITSDILDGNTNNKPYKIIFNNSAFNASAKGKELKIDAVYGLSLNDPSISFTKVDIPTPQYCASMLITPGTNYVDMGAVAPYPFISSYGYNSSEKVPYLMYNGGVLGKRGNLQQLFFHVDSGDLIAGGTCLAKPSIVLPDKANAMNVRAYPIMKTGCVYGIQIKKLSNANSSGTVSAIPVCFSDPGFSSNTISHNVGSLLQLNLSGETKNHIDYNLGDYPINDTVTIGVQLSASSDYIVGNQDGFIIILLIEY